LKELLVGQCSSDETSTYSTKSVDCYICDHKYYSQIIL
jgi:hypothetical protein